MAEPITDWSSDRSGLCAVCQEKAAKGQAAVKTAERETSETTDDLSSSGDTTDDLPKQGS
jgi:hypothetical protein